MMLLLKWMDDEGGNNNKDNDDLELIHIAINANNVTITETI